ncbi:hypothetical protein [Methylocaldum szegediense]|uniref:Uncharacterized protein n=1 Tax=Methylocaldum szegediense TaxID=73780 RepID=A0ABM9I5K3_9GAMM|nr:hypothetical protein [Methylocaldum szegediense]CAI8903892.1 protein of unknown function [Methylocaldum szegediense]
MGPDTYCTGYSTLFSSWLTGIFDEETLQLDGQTPTGPIWGEGYSYHINAAAAVPLLGALVLLASGVVGLFGWGRCKS